MASSSSARESNPLEDNAENSEASDADEELAKILDKIVNFNETSSKIANEQKLNVPSKNSKGLNDEYLASIAKECDKHLWYQLQLAQQNYEQHPETTQSAINEVFNKRKQQLEQEQQGHELALQLAKENNENLEDSPSGVKNKYNLTRWKYSELRDAINTSCDIELLEACRHEFHRRLKVYHAWKAKSRMNLSQNESKTTLNSIMESDESLPLHDKHSKSHNAQRYFRIPFTRPATIQNTIPNDTGKKGWWFAHFNGEYVARQMELHPEKAAVLLVAGRDDMQMCELSLEETGLTRKGGAEILQTEFDREWQKYGGEIYIRPADRK